MPEEPSVLDYLKSKLKFWERGGKIKIPPESEPPQDASQAVEVGFAVPPQEPVPAMGQPHFLVKT